MEVELFKTIQQRVKLISIYFLSLTHIPQKHPKMLANIHPFSLPLHSPRAIKSELHHCFSIAIYSDWKAKLLEMKIIWQNYIEMETNSAELQGNRSSLPKMPRELLLCLQGHLLSSVSPANEELRAEFIKKASPMFFFLLSHHSSHWYPSNSVKKK